MTFSITIPSARIPLTDGNGIITREYYLFFCTILQALGGQSVVQIPGTITVIDNILSIDGAPAESTLSQRTAADVEDLRARYQSTDTTAQLALQQVGDVEARYQQSDITAIDAKRTTDDIMSEIATLRTNNDELRRRITDIEDMLGR